MGLFDLLFGTAQAEPTDGKSVLATYLKPEHKYILVADQGHRDPTTDSWFFSDENLAELKQLGINKIGVECDDETTQQIITDSLSKKAFIADQPFSESLSAMYDGIKKAHSLGFEIRGIDVEHGIERFLNRRYAGALAGSGAKFIAELGDVLLEKIDRASDDRKAVLRQQYAEFLDNVSVARKLDGFLGSDADRSDNRLYFDPKVAEQIREFAGDGRVAVAIGAAHFMGSHHNVAESLGLGNTLIITSGPDSRWLSNGPALPSLLPHADCSTSDHCRLDAPTSGEYDQRKIEKYVMGRYRTAPYKNMDYAGVTSPEERKRLETVETIYDSAQLPVRRSDQFGPN